MDYSLITEKIPYYILFLFLFILAQSFSMWGQYVTLPYKNLSMWEAYKMAIPFAWLDWIVMTFTVMVGDKFNLVTPTHDTLLLIIIQFSLVLLINEFYLKKQVTRSDIIAFFIILFGFMVSFLHLTSKFFNIEIPKHQGTNNPDTAHSTLKVQMYDTLVVKNENPMDYTAVK